MEFTNLRINKISFYFVQTLIHPLPQTTQAAMDIWENYQNSFWPFLFHILAIGFGALAIWKGVKSIEKVNIR